MDLGPSINSRNHACDVPTLRYKFEHQHRAHNGGGNDWLATPDCQGRLRDPGIRTVRTDEAVGVEPKVYRVPARGNLSPPPLAEGPRSIAASGHQVGGIRH